LNLYMQGVDPGLDFSNIEDIRETYERCTRMDVSVRHPYAGELVFTAFSGSHQDAINKGMKAMEGSNSGLWEVPYLPVDPHDVGRSYEAVIRVNSQSGKGGVAFVLERDFGLSLPRWLQVELAQEVQKHSEKQGGEVDSDTINRIFRDRFVVDSNPVALTGYQLDRSGGRDAITVHITDRGVKRSLQGSGEGALSAFVDALTRNNQRRIAVVDYNEHAIGEGTNAEAVTYVQLNIDGQRVSGVAIDRDVVSASMKAVLSAWNRSILQAEGEPRQKVA